MVAAPTSRADSATPPRVLAIDQAGEAGGAQYCLLDLTGAYTGDEMSVLLLSDGPFRARLAANGIPVEVAQASEAFVRVPRGSNIGGMLKGLGGMLAMGAQAARIARRHDVIYANTQKALLIGAIAATLSHRPFVWHLHDILTVADTSRTVHRLARFFGNRFADLVIVNSEATRDSFVSIGGKAPMTLIYNGIDPARFESALDAPLRPAAVPANAPLVGVFSRLSEWKGQHVAIEAIARIAGAHLVLVGGPLFGQQAYEARLHALAHALGVEDRVHFIGDQPEVARWMCGCDIVLHSSTLAEPFGRVVVEGMLSGRPVVATRAGGVPEILEEGVTGLMIEPENAEAMTAALQRLLTDRALADRLAAAARPAALSRFGVDRYRREVKQALRSVVPAAAG